MASRDDSITKRDDATAQSLAQAAARLLYAASLMVQVASACSRMAMLSGLPRDDKARGSPLDFAVAAGQADHLVEALAPLIQAMERSPFREGREGNSPGPPGVGDAGVG